MKHSGRQHAISSAFGDDTITYGFEPALYTLYMVQGIVR